MEFLDEEKVRSLLTWESLIPAVERALMNLSLGKIQQPVRTVLRIAEHEGFFALMPAVDGDLMGVKLVTFYERNTVQPTHQAVIQLFSAETGEPLLAMDGRLITEMRTAAVSAVATRLFAAKDARTLANRALRSLRKGFVHDGETLSVTASIGAVVISDAETDVDDVLRDADIAMYSAKAKGKNQIAMFQPVMTDWCLNVRREPAALLERSPDLRAPR